MKKSVLVNLALCGCVVALPEVPGVDEFVSDSTENEILALTPDTFDHQILRECDGPAVVAFFGRPPAGSQDLAAHTKQDQELWEAFQEAAPHVNQMVCFFSFDCKAYPAYCDELNVASTPTMFAYQKSPSLEITEMPGAWPKPAILSILLKMIKLAAKQIHQVSSNNIDSFLQDNRWALKAVLFTNRKTTPVVLESLSADPVLWPHWGFAVAKHTDRDLTRRFEVSEVPKLVLFWEADRKLGGSVSRGYTAYSGEMNCATLRKYLRTRVDAYLESVDSSAGAFLPLSSTDERAEVIANAIEAGSELAARLPTPVYSDVGDWETLHLLGEGDFVTARGTPRTISGLQLVPIEPEGAVELRALAWPEEILTVPGYQILPYGTKKCPAGLEITTVEECQTAIISLGKTPQPAWISNYAGLPSYCSLREKVDTNNVERMHFNSDKDGNARSDLAPVCKTELPGRAKDASKGKSKASNTKFDDNDELTRAIQEAIGLRPKPGAAKADDKAPKPKPGSASDEMKEALKKMKDLAQDKHEEGGKTSTTTTSGGGKKTKAKKRQKLAELSDYMQMEYGAPGCPPGLEILSVGECEAALKSLGLTAHPAWLSAYPGLPMKCSVREAPTKESPERMHFNAAQEGAPRADLAPICRKPDQEKTIVSEFEE
mmetsp:Transcript_98796/g.205953  ORF Transcript_98796/g.205953 Transcript_98796/m.205953 type:complete len:659 (-) Transcript_98796:199-2175(-)|eukprot:CAMPEP_0206492054 /NCGR_PEP_ID=MMETSP0324_2-20121206/45646_1 /ASSEMBLY_ACC=CAM_ASM_000836 /TAXON_ID=2866 /ORGANISM="Crypthecodinium cohnii, Strain Seligo" /LENGTH=658 /DNA_ID=CAMNT_0053973929 /DNA_START=80 /DNA_END=2056 /DNA_ORIENTATION=+